MSAPTMTDAARPAERDFRGPGCDARCRVISALVPGVFGRSEILVHDPAPHEDYGRLFGWPDPEEHTVRTGRLAINLRSLVVTVNDVRVRLTALELKLLGRLARQLGAVVRYGDLAAALFGTTDDGTSWQPATHAIRVNVSRLRDKLGDEAGPLIVTVVGLGLRLDAIAPGAVPEPDPWTSRPSERPWSAAAAACLGCGESRWPHAGHGYCQSCRDRTLAPRTRHRFYRKEGTP